MYLPSIAVLVLASVPFVLGHGGGMTYIIDGTSHLGYVFVQSAIGPIL